MDDFARLPADERRVYFEQAAAQLNLSAQVIEKDFWVCWTLRQLFSLADFQQHLTFKGGTSLSKVYQLIERFSEDVDVAIDREFLGFSKEEGPEADGISGKEQTRRIDRLKETCQKLISEQLLPQLKQLIGNTLGKSGTWSLQLDTTDPDMQSLRFEYPPAIVDGISPYFARSVKIELGARSDHYPVEQKTVQPYLCDAFPESIAAPRVEVHVLSAERTFWEKATILHWVHHMAESKAFPLRMSRHYYDLFQLANSRVLDDALDNIDLLKRVAEFKAVYFKVGWAKYDEAASGALRLMPSEPRIGDLYRDYVAMGPMFFGEPPAIEDILALLPDLEEKINERVRVG